MSDGRIVETDRLTVIDAHVQPWERNPGIPGARMKILARHRDGWESVMLNWLPPDLGGGDPHRHYHRSVRERGLVLDGELPMAEFRSGQAGPGCAVLFRAGFYMDRAPGCVHGLNPRSSSSSGFTILEWRDGPGTYLLEESAQEESIVEVAPAEAVPLAPDPRPGVVIQRDDLTLLDVFELPWEEVPGEPGIRVQNLSDGAESRAAGMAAGVTIAYAPHGESVQVAATPPGGAPQRAYVLGGSLELDSGVSLARGCFLEQRHGPPLSAVAGETGCRLLRF